MNAASAFPASDRPLLLFDIDGTLIRTGSVSLRPAFTHVLQLVLGIERIEHWIDASGMLDRQIFADVARLHGREYTAEKISEACLAMSEYSRTVEVRAVGLPGVLELLRILQERGFPLGVLTGNMEEMAWRKLTIAGLRDPFSFGAFGDEADRRADLVPLAVARARQTYGVEFANDRVWIVGDTPRDIACARDNGAKVIAVATGKWTGDQLAELYPDVLLPDLSNAAAFLAAIGSAPSDLLAPLG